MPGLAIEERYVEAGGLPVPCLAAGGASASSVGEAFFGQAWGAMVPGC